MRQTGTICAIAAAAAGIGILSAHADVRVWTDQQEVVLKGTLQGIEVLTDPDTSASAPKTPQPDETVAPLRDIRVAGTRALYDAIGDARPGDRIVLAPGIYDIDRNSIAVKQAGTAANPIVVTAEERNKAVIRMTGQNGFLIGRPYWVFENLTIEGACAEDATCEHAFHIVAGGDHTILRGNRIVDFNAPIKGNGTQTTSGWVRPDFVLIENNDIYNTRERDTDNPVTGIDVVGGRGWVVRGNYIADFGKKRGNRTTYAAFLKGDSSDGTFERNLVVCGKRHSGGQRVGLSFGGGGTNLTRYCAGKDCTSEHRGGTMRNNIVMSCNDVGIYLNRAAETQIFNNMLYDTGGIDLRYSETTADIRNNILSGVIRLRNGATDIRRNNVIVASPVQFNTWFADPAHASFSLINRNFFVDKGEAAPGLTDDFCGNKRVVGAPDIGALEFIPLKTCNVAQRMNEAN